MIFQTRSSTDQTSEGEWTKALQFETLAFSAYTTVLCAQLKRDATSIYIAFPPVVKSSRSLSLA